jgi:hypothetical protein
VSSISHPSVPLKQQRLGGGRGAKLIALALGLVAAVVVTLVLVIDGDSPAPSTQSGAEAVAPARAPVSPLNGTRYDGGPEEGTRGAVTQAPSTPVSPTTRYDGGPEEGSRGLRTQAPAQAGQGQAFPGLSDQARKATPDVAPPPSSIAAGEGSSYGQLRQSVPPTTRYDGGPEEGTRGATQSPAPDGPTPFSGARP